MPADSLPGKADVGLRGSWLTGCRPGEAEGEQSSQSNANGLLVSSELFFLKKKHFYWHVVDLQRCVSFRHTAKRVSFAYAHLHSFSDSFLVQVLQNIE